MKWLRARSWSPYAAGALLGVLSWFAFATADQPLGVSSAFVRVVGFVESGFIPAHVAATPYFAKTGLVVGWELMLVIGLFLGALVSARLSGDRSNERVPSLWAQRFGTSAAKRYGAAFLGGAILMFGARLAGGCTSGHGISGGLQLALSSWTFLAAVFVSGIATAFALYGKETSHA